MRCPYCRVSLKENDPECPGCRLDLERASRILGALPRLTPGLSDDAQVLDPGGRKRIVRRVEDLQHRFPQIRIQIVIRGFGRDHPLSLYCFWIFNLGGLSSGSEKGSDNHTVLVTIDPDRQESCLMVGYGLEPFFEEEELDAVLDLAESKWAENEWAAGMLLLFDGLEALLERSAKRLARVYDYSPNERHS